MRFLRHTAAVAALAGVAAWASIPGNVDPRSFEGLLHVCVDEEPGHPQYIVCDDQAGGFPDAPYTGAECTAAGLPAACEIDFIPGAKANGLLTLIADDTPFPENPRTTILYRFRAGGAPHLVADTFDTDSLGNWNALNIDGGEIAVFGNISTQDTSVTEFQFMDGNLSDLGDEITAIVDAAEPGIDLSGAVPVFIEATHRPDKLESDQSAFDQPLASLARHRMKVRFARLRP